MPDAIRIAIVGFGKIARDQHVPSIAATPGIELAAVVSRNARPVGAPDGVPHFPDIEALLGSATAVDAVALCAPPQVRRAQAAAALAAGKHVLLEKPPGATMTEVAPLAAAAAAHNRTLFASWHSRFAPAVEPARAFLAEHAPRAVTITWKEDVRVWHPGQDWIWQPGGFGVFDPGINALSILTRILPRPVFLLSADLTFPANRAAPIAARLALADEAGVPVAAEFDFRQTGPQTWSITADTDAGPLTLRQGGKALDHDGRSLLDGGVAEYRALYQHFVELVRAGRSDVDLAPLALVADSFMLGRRTEVAPFED